MTDGQEYALGGDGVLWNLLRLEQISRHAQISRRMDGGEWYFGLKSISQLDIYPSSREYAMCDGKHRLTPAEWLVEASSLSHAFGRC